MATFNKFQPFVEALSHGKHNLGSDQLVVALTNSAPSTANSVLANITQISYTNLSTRNVSRTSSAQTAGTYKLVLADLEITASGTIPEFRYVVLYNDTATNDDLIGWWDRGSGIVLQNGDKVTIDFDNVNGVIELT